MLQKRSWFFKNSCAIKDLMKVYFVSYFIPKVRPRPYYAGEIWTPCFILFLRLSLPSTLICHVNVAFRKRWRHDNHVISLHEFYSNSNPKWPVIVTFLNFSSVVWRKTFDAFSDWKRCFQISILQRSLYELTCISYVTFIPWARVGYEVIK